MITRNPDVQNSNGSQFNKYPYWAPRIWHGMSTRKWFRLLSQNRFAVNRYHLAMWITLFGGFNSFANRLQAALYRKKSRQIGLAGDPIFILGHWRTGTTFLHTLFSLDDRYWPPTTYECFTPHFLVSQWAGPRFLKFPSRRPMDNMSMSWNQPQEDDLALCVRGAPSVYRNVAFPAAANVDLESLDPDEMAPHELKLWKDTFLDFVRYVNFSRRRPLVLKSPPHTGRVALLLELFPRAKFIHLTRDPEAFIPSTVHLWNALHATNGLRSEPAAVDCEDYVFDCFHRIYGSYERSKHLIPDENHCEVNYRELTADPVQTMQRIYSQLGLADFRQVASKVRDLSSKQQGYQPNQHHLPDRLANRIRFECADYRQRYCEELAQPMRRSA